MSTQEVKIRITEERSGSAIRDTKRDLDDLEKGKGTVKPNTPKPAPKEPDRAESKAPPREESRPLGPVPRYSMDTLERHYEQKDRAGEAAAASSKKPSIKDEIKAAQQAIASTKLEEDEARADGRKGEADALAKEVRELEAAVELQQKLGVSQAEALQLAKASVAAKEKISAQAAHELELERKIKQERKDQALLEKANIRQQGRFAQVGQSLASGRMPTPSSAMAMGGGLMGAAAGPLAIAIAIGSALKGILGAGFDAEKKDISSGHRMRESGARDRRGIRRQVGIFGSSSSAVGSSVDTKEEIEERIEHKPELMHQAKLGKLNPLRWMDDAFGTENWRRGGGGLGWWKSDGARSVDENEERIEQLEHRRRAERAAAKHKFLNEEGGLEMKIARARAQRDLPGLKEARHNEAALTWMKEYKRLAAESGDDAIAKEGADIKVQEYQRDLQMRAGSGLVNAASGSADIARAASIADMQLPEQDRLQQEVKSMHQTLKTQLDALNETAGKKHF